MIVLLNASIKPIDFFANLFSDKDVEKLKKPNIQRLILFFDRSAIEFMFPFDHPFALPTMNRQSEMFNLLCTTLEIKKIIV